MYLTKDKSGVCRTLQQGEAWTSVSKLECFAACTSAYPDTCQSIVYNEVNNMCIPGGTSFAEVETLQNSIPEPDSTETLFYVKSAIPACNTSNGFALYELCGTTVCLYLSTSLLPFDHAVKFCNDKDSSLFIANTWARFSLFWYTSLNELNQNTFLWLSYNAEKGQFVWGNGELLSAEFNNIIWGPNQPDNLHREHCAEARHLNWPGVYGINNAHCTDHNSFICEPNS
ncbi:hypothetical protein PoB_000234600 [Plakobranchus ocellatus]|uniref:C-type lectin domain-containing protein n=1 Tax=Plakobranchus ocellatus TaxID=259542 RepID=A0AAV3XYD9_9GAST|nr:hypothetical protein PoB_000234600 [Plakobranchus ocellatus]